MNEQNIRERLGRERRNLCDEIYCADCPFNHETKRCGTISDEYSTEELLEAILKMHELYEDILCDGKQDLKNKLLDIVCPDRIYDDWDD